MLLRSVPGILAGPFELQSDDERFKRLFFSALRRPPPGTEGIATVETVSLTRGATETTVGLTRYIPSASGSAPSQTISFYSELFGELSDQAATGVIAHELAHAWLNEHSGPEESKAREREADLLARRWGFGPELDALDGEAYTVNG
jgi:hypothetical protein